MLVLGPNQSSLCTLIQLKEEFLAPIVGKGCAWIVGRGTVLIIFLQFSGITLVISMRC